MGKRRRILLASLLLIIGSGLVFVIARPRDPEPVYQGKTLSDWCDVYYWNLTSTNIGPLGNWDPSFGAAMLKAGTNAIPHLLRMLRTQDSPNLQKLAALLQKQQYVPIHYTAPSSRYPGALQGLQALGLQSTGDVQELIRIYDENPRLQAELPSIFASMGPRATAAIPSLLRRVPHTNEVVQGNALAALGEIHAEPELVVPSLVKALKDRSEWVRSSAAIALGHYGTNAKVAVPALLELHNVHQPASTSPNSVCWIEWALKKIEPEAAAKLHSH